MRIVIANCAATYSGRGDTKLGMAVRALIIKADGSVSIHNDVSNKPLNYMKEADLTIAELADGTQQWIFDARKESLCITISDILSDTTMPLVENDEGLVRDGTEAHLQEWIATHPEVLGEGFTLVQREYPTGNGPVDLLVRDAQGLPVAVEVKRVAMLGVVYQTRRYVDALKSDNTEETAEFNHVRGMIAALDIRPKTKELADKRGIETIVVPKPARWLHAEEREGTSTAADDAISPA